MSVVTPSPSLDHSGKPPQKVTITAVEEDDEEEGDVISGALSNGHLNRINEEEPSESSRRGFMGIHIRKGKRHHNQAGSTADASSSREEDELQLSHTDHNWSGEGILASRNDLNLSMEEFAAGCNLLQAAAQGNVESIHKLLAKHPNHVNFRDYDRRTALHVAASEGHLHVCKLLVEKYHARVNRSDRWGGSPLDDAHRHRQQAVVQYLREKGATTGSGMRSTNLIQAAADGDYDEVKVILKKIASYKRRQKNRNIDNSSSSSGVKFFDRSHLDLNKGDYDQRTALHLAAGEGHVNIIEILLDNGADPNVVDRWGRTPLDDALDGNHDDCIHLLRSNGAVKGTTAFLQTNNQSEDIDNSNNRVLSNMEIDFKELKMIDRVGAGAFGEIYKCRWRGTLVAAKIIKTAKIRQDWLQSKALQNIKDGGDVDDAIRDLDEANLPQSQKEMALNDFRREISVVKSLRHPNIVLMLAYSTTERYECIISELCKCSLWDLLKANSVHGTRIPKKTQYIYAQQLAQGMNYLHTCHPPIIHRDLKPANLLIDHSGTLKISDFGLSKIRPDPGQMEADLFEMTGETGSYRFMAPEVFRHEKYNETVDVYSFAMILFHLLVGRPPWPTLPGHEAVRLAAEEGDRPTIPRDLDARSMNLLKECWHEEPSARPSFQQILDFLHGYMKDVFHSDIDNVATADSPDWKKQVPCRCVIM